MTHEIAILLVALLAGALLALVLSRLARRARGSWRAQVRAAREP